MSEKEKEPQHKCPGCGKMVDDAWGKYCVVCHSKYVKV